MAEPSSRGDNDKGNWYVAGYFVESVADGKDLQLEAAVDALLKQLDNQ